MSAGVVPIVEAGDPDEAGVVPVRYVTAGPGVVPVKTLLEPGVGVVPIRVVEGTTANVVPVSET